MKFDIKKQKIRWLSKEIDKRTLFISAFAALVVLFYVNPLGHVALTKWDRTFSTAAIAGIYSPQTRVSAKIREKNLSKFFKVSPHFLFFLDQIKKSP